jgi:hypothetical protein
MNKSTTRTAVIKEDDFDIIHLVFFPETMVTYDDAVINSKEITRISDGEKYLKLIDGSAANLTFDKAAQHFMESKITTRRSIATAILVNRTTLFETLTFFSSLSDSKIATKVFYDHESAMDWLKSLRTL